MKILKKICSLLGLIMITTSARGQEPSHWSSDIHAYQYDMTVYLQIKEAGTPLTDYSDYELAAFCGEECRGIATFLNMQGEDPVTIARIRVRSNTVNGETINFKAYKKSSLSEISFINNVVFENLKVYGTPSMPITLLQSSVVDEYSFYLTTVNGAPGQTIKYPLYMDNTMDAKDITFYLSFPSKLLPRLEVVDMADNAVGYTTSAKVLNETDYVFSMSGGTLGAATTKLLAFYVDIPEDMETGTSYQAVINKISITEPDGTSVSGRTKNGRIGVYKMGDVNGDNQVNVTDVVGALNLIKETGDDSLIKEVADPNEDGDVNITDVVGIIEIIKSNSNEE